MRSIFITAFVCSAVLSYGAAAFAAKYDRSYQQYPATVTIGPNGVAARPPVACETTTKKSQRWFRTMHSTTRECAVD
jgi:hypothetical protein